MRLGCQRFQVCIALRANAAALGGLPEIFRSGASQWGAYAGVAKRQVANIEEPSALNCC
jgi:hypothetical protein